MSSTWISNFPNVGTYAKACAAVAPIVAWKVGNSILDTASSFCPGSTSNTTSMWRLYSDRTVSIPLLGDWNYILPIITSIAIPLILKKEVILRKTPEFIKKPLTSLRGTLVNVVKDYGGYVVLPAVVGSLWGLPLLESAVMAGVGIALYNLGKLIGKNENPDQTIKKLDLSIRQISANSNVINEELGELIKSNAELRAKYSLALGKILEQERKIKGLSNSNAQLLGSSNTQKLQGLKKELEIAKFQNGQLIKILQELVQQRIIQGLDRNGNIILNSQVQIPNTTSGPSSSSSSSSGTNRQDVTIEEVT